MFKSSLIFVLALGCTKQGKAVAPVVVTDAASVVETEAAPEVAVAATPADGKWIHYGSEFSVESEVTAAALLSSPQDHMDGVIRVTDATITDVCQAKGCWLVIADGDRNMRIFTKDHAFAVAKDSGGSQCELEGSVVSKQVKAEFVEHLESESTDVASMPEKGLAEGDTVYEFVASAVRVNGQTQVSIPVGEAPVAPETEVSE